MRWWHCFCNRYPAPSWWPAILAFIPASTSKSDNSGAADNDTAAVAAAVVAGYQPDSFVFIKDKRYRLAKIPTNSSQILIDLGEPPSGSTVAVGDSVCIICAQHSLGALGEVSRQSSELQKGLLSADPISNQVQLNTAFVHAMTRCPGVWTLRDAVSNDIC